MSAPDPEHLGDDLHRAADGTTPKPVDVEQVLARSRSARRARVRAIAGGAGAVLALVAAAGIVASIQPSGTLTASDYAPSRANGGSAQHDGAAESSATAVAPQDEPETSDVPLGRLGALAACGAGLPATTVGDGLRASLAGGSIGTDGTGEIALVVENAGTTPVVGTIVAATLAIADGDGVVATSAIGVGAPIDLAPGTSVAVTVQIGATACGETAGAALTAGDRTVVATIETETDGADETPATVVLVTAPAPLAVG